MMMMITKVKQKTLNQIMYSLSTIVKLKSELPELLDGEDMDRSLRQVLSKVIFVSVLATVRVRHKRGLLKGSKLLQLLFELSTRGLERLADARGMLG